MNENANQIHVIRETRKLHDGRPVPAGTKRYICTCFEEGMRWAVAGSDKHCTTVLLDHIAKTGAKIVGMQE